MDAVVATVVAAVVAAVVTGIGVTIASGKAADDMVFEEAPEAPGVLCGEVDEVDPKTGAMNLLVELDGVECKVDSKASEALCEAEVVDPTDRRSK
jgi:hypothetical protein